MLKPDRYWLLLLAGLSMSSGSACAQAYYLCQDPQTGKKVGQDKPCQAGKQINTYAPASAAELKAREETARQNKREFERAHPGTYRPEEYMTAEEYAEYQAKEKDREKEREAERQKRETQQAIEAASRKAAQAEQRAIEAEAAARQAEARAKAAAEEAATRNAQPQMLMPRLPSHPPRPGHCGRPGSSQEDCVDDTSRPAPKRETTPFPTPSVTPRPL